MDAIQLARQLGKAIQEDARFLNMRLAEQKNEDDKELQALITKFNGHKEELNAEMRKPERDKAKIVEMNGVLEKLYAEIFQSDNMKDYVSARNDMKSLMGLVNQIISGSAEGKDPDSIEYEDCGSGCSSCSGCS